MKVNSTVPFVIIKNIIDDIKTSFTEFLSNPDPDNSNSMFWYITITFLFSLGGAISEAFFMWPIQMGDNHYKLFWNDGPNSILLWLLTMCITSLFCMFGWLIIGFIHWLIMSYINHYYDKYGSPSDELRNYDTE